MTHAADRRPLRLLLALRSRPLAAPPPALAPADRWPQFRGSPALLGTTAATLPPR